MDCLLRKQSSIFAGERQIKQLSSIRKQLAKVHKVRFLKDVLEYKRWSKQSQRKMAAVEAISAISVRLTPPIC